MRHRSSLLLAPGLVLALLAGCFATTPLDDEPAGGPGGGAGSGATAGVGSAGQAGAAQGAGAGSAGRGGTGARAGVGGGAGVAGGVVEPIGGGSAGSGAGGGGGNWGGSNAPPPENACDAQGVAVIETTTVDKLDLLFVVDNSGSMREEQVSLAQEFPRMLRVLASGDLGNDGIQDFSPVRDIHLGVVSTNMGLVGVQGIPGCEGLGDDGVMQNIPRGNDPLCQSTYPRFLSYVAGIHDPSDTAVDFRCIAQLGTDGCGFEQPLEAALKALWPSVDIDPITGQVNQPNRIRFLGDVNGFGQLGHGDQENNGFLRNDPTQGISIVAVVVVTDEEDCSSAETRHFTPDVFLPENDPLRDQDLNLRCFFNPGNLYVLDRYVNGLRALRPGAESRVVFGAIVGVPTDLVDANARADVDFDDPAQRELFYENILADSRMQEVPDPNRTAEQGGNLTPSCISDIGRAYPPRRIVEVARRFGENGAIGSICDADFRPAVDTIVRAIGRQTGARCLPRLIPRQSDGTIDCTVLWELPPPNSAPAATPISCDERDFLSDEYDEVTASGGRVCSVGQVPVVNQQANGSGWFYDDFSDFVATECRDTRQRIAFTSDAEPPTGVVVKIACNDTFVVCP